MPAVTFSPCIGDAMVTNPVTSTTASQASYRLRRFLHASHLKSPLHSLRCSASSAKSHACFACSLASALTTAPRRYQLFAVLNCRGLRIVRGGISMPPLIHSVAPAFPQNAGVLGPLICRKLRIACGAKRGVKTCFSGFAGINARPLALKEF